MKEKLSGRDPVFVLRRWLVVLHVLSRTFEITRRKEIGLVHITWDFLRRALFLEEGVERFSHVIAIRTFCAAFGCQWYPVIGLEIFAEIAAVLIIDEISLTLCALVALAWVEKLAVLAAMHVGIAMRAFVLASDFAEKPYFATTAMTNHIQKIANKGRLKQSADSEDALINDFRGQLRDLLLSHFPLSTIRNAQHSSRPSPGSQLLGFTLEYRSQRHLVLAAAPDANIQVTDTILAAGLSWKLRSNARGLWLLLPAGQATITLNRLSLMNSDTASV